MLALTKWVVSPYAGKKWDMIRLNFTLFQSAIFIIILSLSFCLSKSPLLYKLISLPYTFYLLPLFSCPHPSPFLVMLAFMASTMTPLSMTPKSASVPRLFSRALGLFCQLPCCLEWARLLCHSMGGKPEWRLPQALISVEVWLLHEAGHFNSWIEPIFVIKSD